MLKKFLSFMFAVAIASSFSAFAAGKKGEDCDPKKVDKVRNQCMCDPATHEWVVDECLVKCDAGTMRIGKLCQKQCSLPLVSFNGECIEACPKGETMDSTGKCRASECGDAEGNVNGVCVEKCNNNQELIGTKCYEKCGNYYERVGTECLEKCGNTKERVGQECVEPCGNSKERINGMCVDKCGNKKERVGHDCRDKCKEGYKRDNDGQCIACQFDSVASK